MVHDLGSVTAHPRMELCWGTLGLTSFQDLVNAAAHAGFSAVTVPSSLCGAMVRDQRRLRALREQMADVGVVITTVDPLVRGLPGIRGRDAMPAEYRTLLDSTAADCADFAAALGATTVNIAHVTGESIPLAQLCEAMGGFAAALGARGVRGAIEFIPGTGIPDLSTVRSILAGVGAANLGITFDTWHFSRAGGTLHDLAALEPGCVFGLQINDARGVVTGGPHVPGAGRLLPGAGTLPLVDILMLLLQSQPDIYVGVEVFSEELRQMGPERAAIVAFAAAARVVDRLRVAGQES
jgi:sugar phosphate isomerase/epimerase